MAAAGVVVVVVLGIVYAASQLPSLGANGLLHPVRRQVASEPPESCEDAAIAGEGITLRGWRCRASTTARRGTIVYLHGIADNRVGSAGVIERFGRRGFDVVAYDSRAHGASGGDACTYGYFEKQDLRRVLDGLDHGPAILIGSSLGAAVALQAAADDRRITAVVAAEAFSDLRTAAIERVPFFFAERTITRAFELAEQQGGFDVDAVSPLNAAAAIAAPVLLIHGDRDVDTPPDHARRIFAALRGRKRLVIVPGAAHNGSLRGEVWRTIEQWIDEVLEPR